MTKFKEFSWQQKETPSRSSGPASPQLGKATRCLESVKDVLHAADDRALLIMRHSYHPTTLCLYYRTSHDMAEPVIETEQIP